jgi:hypothetical protein
MSIVLSEQQIQLFHRKLKNDKFLELTRIETDKIVQQEQIAAKTLVIHQRTNEARFFGCLLLLCGLLVAYQTYHTTDFIVDFLQQITLFIKTPFLPNWETYLLDENSFVSGWCAKGVNAFLRLFLLGGVSVKRILLLGTNLLAGIASMGTFGAITVVVLITIFLTVVCMKLYINDFKIGSPLVWMSFEHKMN